MVTDTSSLPRSQTTGDLRYIDVGMIHVNHKKLRKLSEAKINRYMLDYERGDDFPPLSVNDCGGFYTVRDGRHRLQAQLRAGFAFVAVCIRL